MNKKKINYIDNSGRVEELYLSVRQYVIDNQIYLGLEDIDEELIYDITINLENQNLSNNVICLSPTLPAELTSLLRDINIIEEHIKTVQYCDENYECYRINFDKIYEYAPKEYEQYLSSQLEDGYSL